MKCFAAIAAMCLAMPALAGATDGQNEGAENLVWEYARFVQAFRAKDWSNVCDFVSDSTKAGFGPAQEGCEGVKRVYAGDGPCWDEMVFALRQGCRKTSINGEPACVSPPQWNDDDVAYLGARAAFVFDAGSGRWMAQYLVCGGD